MKAHWVLAVLLLGCSRPVPRVPAEFRARPISKPVSLIVQGARGQLSWGTGYDSAYYRIPYPGGDLPRSKGVCTDVVVRSLRCAGYDLQKLVHEDMQRAWNDYPRYPDRDSPDPNIDHRRVPNQRVFFQRHGVTCPLSVSSPADWQPGDIVEWKLPSGRDHTGVLTNRLDAEGFPYVIHNIGNGPQEEDVLRALGWRIVGHFRYPR